MFYAWTCRRRPCVSIFQISSEARVSAGAQHFSSFQSTAVQRQESHSSIYTAKILKSLQRTHFCGVHKVSMLRHVLVVLQFYKLKAQLQLQEG